MSLKVGSTPIAGPAIVRGGQSTTLSAPVGMLQQIGGMNASPSVGPEDQSLLFQESWDNLQQQQKKQAARNVSIEGVRFGDILTTTDVSTTLVNYQAAHGISTLPSVRFGAMIYEMSMQAINNNGALRAAGTTVNRLS